MSIVKQFKGNKVLSSAEFVTLFKKYDKDGNGVIEKGELTAFLSDLCQELGDENPLKCDIKKLGSLVLSKYDVNRDGKLSMDEMSKVLPTEKNFLMNFRSCIKLTSVEFMEVWFHYDLDKSGYLEGSEIEGFIHDFLEKAGMEVNPAKIKDYRASILDTIDTDHDGKISLSELSELLPAEENFFKKYEHRDRLNGQDFSEIFNHYDKDKSGQIEDQELMALLRDVAERDGADVLPSSTALEAKLSLQSKYNKVPTLSDLEDCKKEILKIVDVNKDGKVSRDELALLLSSDSA